MYLERKGERKKREMNQFFQISKEKMNDVGDTLGKYRMNAMLVNHRQGWALQKGSAQLTIENSQWRKC